MNRLLCNLSAAAWIAFAVAGPANAQFVPPAPPTITVQPQPATVGSGAGVTFWVGARAAPRDVITGYRWYRDGLPVAQGLTRTAYTIAAAIASDAGNYTVEVMSVNGSTVSVGARLTVVSSAWAQLGGRAISVNPNLQQPALALCNGPKLAWIRTNAAGIDELRVSRFNGTWTDMGGALNVNAAAHAAEPSIDCGDWAPAGATGPQQPVVAWSEGAGNQRSIQVKAWNGAAWVPVAGASGAISAAGADARKPVLRLAPNDPHWTSTASIRSHSALAWLESGVARAKLWNGADWQIYIGGHPGGTVQGDPAWVLDTRYTAGGFNNYPPLLAHVSQFGPIGLNQSSISIRVNSSGAWTAVGQRPGPVGTVGAPLRLAGIGFGTNAIGDGAVAVWASGNNANFSIGSAELFGPGYVDALQRPFDPPQPWTTHATAATGFDLNTLSMDARTLRTQCPVAITVRTSIALAVNDFNGTRVITTRCNGAPAAALDWMPVAPTLRGAANALSLKMETDTIPVLAMTQATSGGHQLSVWRFYP